MSLKKSLLFVGLSLVVLATSAFTLLPNHSALTVTSGGAGRMPGVAADVFEQSGSGERTPDDRPRDGSGRGLGNGLAPLSEQESEGLILAIQEELGAQALYEAVLAAFGPEVPFLDIAESEANHAATLIRQAEKYGLDVPDVLPTVDISFSSFAEACQAGADAEIADAALYDTIMAYTIHEDLLRVYSNLQRASLENHLPEFEACAP